jgi:methylmalonyl-CoA mutase N-terminal domain/subunit
LSHSKPNKATDKIIFKPEDGVAPEKYSTDLGDPGAYPYTRGIQKDMYRGRLWTMRQYAGFGTAAESNKRYKHLLAQGQTGLSVAFDLPTQMGYDADDIMARGEVGKVGVAISSVEDMEILFKDIPLDKVSTSMTINATAGILLGLYICVARRQNVKLKDIKGTIQNDILKEYIARGTYIYPPKPSMRLITDIFSYCKENVPQWNTVSISGYHIREAGSTAIQEVAFTIANGITYVEAALAAGLDIDDFASRLSFFFNVQNDFFEEVAKFRAARKLWADIMKNKFKAKNPKSWLLRFHSQTAGVSLTAQQPENNVVRVAIQALAAVCGGLPTQEAATLALRTQQIIAGETGAADVVDPLGGSYYVEALTKEIEDGARNYIKRIDEMGGVIRCIEKGFIQKEIQNSSYDFQMRVDSKEAVIVGVNSFTELESAKGAKGEKLEKMKVLKVDPASEKRQINKLKKFKKNRNMKLVLKNLEQIRNAAKESESTSNNHGNLMPLFIKALDEKCTLGEISHALRDVFGVHHENVVI